MFNSIVAFDVETATNKRSSICEIGIAIVRNGKVAESKSWLIKPPGNQYFAFNTQLHGIGPEDTKNMPLFPEVWREVCEYLQNKIVVCHYSAFDMGALQEALDLYGIEYPTFDIMCTIRPAKKTVPGLSRYTLDSVYGALFGEEMENHHHAEDDAAACAEIFIECLRRFDITNREEAEEKFKLKIGHISPESYKNQKAIKTKVNSSANNIVGNVEKNDPDSYFYRKSVCFTGAMSFSSRKDLQQYIADIGGVPTNSVTRQTDILVVGQQDYRVVGESGMSSKQRKAIDLLNKGQEIEILSESDFLRYAADFETNVENKTTFKSDISFSGDEDALPFPGLTDPQIDLANRLKRTDTDRALKLALERVEQEDGIRAKFICCQCYRLKKDYESERKMLIRILNVLENIEVAESFVSEFIEYQLSLMRRRFNFVERCLASQQKSEAKRNGKIEE